MKTQITSRTRITFTLLFTLALAMTSCSTEPVGTSDDIYEDTVSTDEPMETPEVDVTAFEQEVFNAINKHRTSLGMGSLEFNAHAFVAAEEHSAYMIQQGTLSHTNFGNRAKQIAEATGAQSVAENVARNYDSSTAVLEAWLSSPSHRSTLEGDYTHSALSVDYDAEGNPYYTHIFFKK